uniref:Tail protein n=1 Tax=viral metagenome TaxID=1070528 RepID=A0A6M3MB87_9ZZZZ
MIKIETDFTSFRHGIINVIGKVKIASEQGMEKAVKQFMDDALHVPPTVPRETGGMAASHSAFVNNNLVATSASEPTTGEAAPTPLLVAPPTGKELVGTLIVHRRQAASLHEGISRHGTPYKFKSPGSGKKWIEAKVIRFGQKYFGMIAGRIRRAK